MQNRLDLENREDEFLNPYAKRSRDSKGRSLYEEEDEFRTCFQRDRDRILHSKAFRRLKHKTQVYVSPEGDHYRTRLTHTLEVSQIARTIGRALSLNEDLIEAIALGHDLGHTPFGHIGEEVLDKLLIDGFRHNEQSLRVVDFLERRGEKLGLNLTYEVREGILMHSGRDLSESLEGQVIKYADRIAYINHDIDDSIRAGILSEESIPINLRMSLGGSGSERISSMVRDIIINSDGQDRIKMSPKLERDMMDLREFMFDCVYLNPLVKKESEKAAFILTKLFEYYMDKPYELPKDHVKLYKQNGHEDDRVEDMVRDYIAGMTDRYVIRIFKDIYVPASWMRDKSHV